MKTKNKALFVSGCIFGLISIIHLYRIFWPFDVFIGGYAISITTSIVVFVVSLFLAAWMFISIRL